MITIRQTHPCAKGSVSVKVLSATITVPNSAFAVNRIVGAPQSQGAAQQANHNGLAGINAPIGVGFKSVKSV